jgi:macrolide-specific efflux system membrane fusion protein
MKLALLFLACHLGGGSSDELDENLIRKVERGDIVDEVSESGKIAPSFDVDIKAKVSGEVEAVHVEEGQTVAKGDPLYEILDTDYARELSLADVAVRQAQLRVEGAQADLGRMAQAHENHAVSEAEFDRAEREVELMKVELETARVQRRAAQDRLDYTHIIAPIDGVVIVRNVEPGEMVTAGISSVVDGEPDLTIAQVDKLLLEIDLNQVDVAKVRTGQKCRIDLDAYPGVEVPGTVTQIAAAGHTDSARGIDVFTVKVEVDPSQAQVEIKPGMTAEVHIAIGDYADLVKLPAETVFEEEGKSYVYVVKDEDGKKVKSKTEVTIGHRTDREVEIKSGVAEGESFYAQADVKDMKAEIN